MSATDELRRMLDERGVEYSAREDSWGKETYWIVDHKPYRFSERSEYGSCVLHHITPEQAIAATLGSEPPYEELLRCLENDWNIKASWDGLRKFWCIELTEEGVKLRDAMHGTLTAEQVRKAIFDGSSYASYDGAKYYADGIGMQAIADELNATLGRGTCRSTTDDNAWCFVCSECGKSFPRSQLHLAHNHGEINYCPNCGAKVIEEEE